MSNTVTSLLTDEGYGPTMSFSGLAAAVQLAEAISQTIGRPILRAQFVADAASDIARLGSRPFEGLEEKAKWLTEAAESARPTPCGSTELWGSLLQGLDPA